MAKFPFLLKNKTQLKCLTKFGSVGLKYLQKILKGNTPEDIASWLQHYSEEIISKIVTYELKMNNQKNIC
jgi:hypothetical protein